MKRTRKAVLIAGAGPTGLMLANCLAAFGVPFDIVDRKTGPSRESKALAVNILSQYALALIGKRDVLGAQGCHVRRINVFWQGNRLNAVDFRWLDFALKSFVTQPQSATEQELLGALPHGIEVAWGTELLKVVERAASVQASLCDTAGRSVQRQYDYVVGCEGKNSVVRDAIGAKLEGWDYPMHFLLGDFPLAWNRPRDQAYYYVFEETFFVIVPVSAQHWRVVVKRDGPFDANSPVECRQITELAERHLAPGLIAGDPVWLSGAPFYMKVASSLQRGRMFICGDAAHLFSPIGGTGMNTGIQDAFDLAWRLAYVYHGASLPDGLLASYAEERSEAIERGAAAADGATRLIARIETAPERIMPMLPSLRRRRLLKLALPFQQAGFGMEYSRSSAIHYGNPAGGSKPGTICLGVLELRQEVEGQTGARIAPLNTLILAFVARENLAAREAQLSSLLRGLKGLRDAPVSAHVVVFGPAAAAASRRMSDQHVAIGDPAIARRLGARDGTVIAVRPDGIVAFSGELEQPSALFQWLRRWFIAAPYQLAPAVTA